MRAVAVALLGLLVHPTVAGGQQPDRAPVRRATVAEVRDLKAAPGMVFVEGWLMRAPGPCGPCPKGRKCARCDFSGALAERRDDAPARWLKLPHLDPGLVQGDRYRLWLKLHEGYQDRQRDVLDLAVYVRVCWHLDEARPEPPPPALTAMRQVPAASSSRGRGPIQVEAFSLDETEVTAAQYRACVWAGGCLPPVPDRECPYALPDGCTLLREDRRDHPMNCVSRQEAAEYCAWARRRLPTEDEWEAAARGAEGRLYPWGSAALSSRHANVCGRECAGRRGAPARPAHRGRDPWPQTAPGGSLPEGATPEGLRDLAGNVAEWTLPSGCADGGRTDDPACQQGAVRGGSWRSADAAEARGDRRRVTPAWERSPAIGFRCAR